MRTGRPLSEDGLYARDLGVSLKVVNAHGGAEYLKTLSDEQVNLLLWPAIVKFERKSLTARGMTAQPPAGRCFKPVPQAWPVDRMAVAKKIYERRSK